MKLSKLNNSTAIRIELSLYIPYQTKTNLDQSEDLSKRLRKVSCTSADVSLITVINEGFCKAQLCITKEQNKKLSS